jgi:nucleoside 2-deoxyribosyltransferase
VKIYFAGSIRGGRDDQFIYEEIIKLLTEYGTVLTEHVGEKTLSALGEQVVTEKFIFDRDVGWITEADVIVAEATSPSLGVGYEIGIAEKLGKKIICLCRPTEGKSLSAMVRGNAHCTVYDYQDIEELKIFLIKN